MGWSVFIRTLLLIPVRLFNCYGLGGHWVRVDRSTTTTVSSSYLLATICLYMPYRSLLALLSISIEAVAVMAWSLDQVLTEDLQLGTGLLRTVVPPVQHAGEIKSNLKLYQ